MRRLSGPHKKEAPVTRKAAGADSSKVRRFGLRDVRLSVLRVSSFRVLGINPNEYGKV